MLENEGITYFISGMAIGVDMYAAEIVLDLKLAYGSDISLECAIPCEGQPCKWSMALQQRYADIVGKCDKKTLIQKVYTSDCMDKRNRYMVDQAAALIAVWNGRPSGTGKTVRYALTMNKPVRIINPVTLSVEEKPEV